MRRLGEAEPGEEFAQGAVAGIHAVVRAGHDAGGGGGHGDLVEAVDADELLDEVDLALEIAAEARDGQQGALVVVADHAESQRGEDPEGVPGEGVHAGEVAQEGPANPDLARGGGGGTGVDDAAGDGGAGELLHQGGGAAAGEFNPGRVHPARKAVGGLGGKLQFL